MIQESDLLLRQRRTLNRRPTRKPVMTRGVRGSFAAAFSGERNIRSLPRWLAVILALFVWLIAIPLAHGVVPWAISTLARHYGWSDNSPGIWNWLGLIPITIAAALLIWVLISGIAQTPDRVKLGLTPSFLMLRGPYRFRRNPMYVAELGLWLGWALFFGSPGVFLGCVVLFPVVNRVILPREERGLEAAFGPAYSRYKDRVPPLVGADQTLTRYSSVTA